MDENQSQPNIDEPVQPAATSVEIQEVPHREIQYQPHEAALPKGKLSPEATLLFQELSKEVGRVNVYEPKPAKLPSEEVRALKTNENNLVYFLYRTPKRRQQLQKILDTCPFCVRCAPKYHGCWLCVFRIFPCCICSLLSLCCEFLLYPLCVDNPIGCVAECDQCAIMPNAWWGGLWLTHLKSDEPMILPESYTDVTKDDLLSARQSLILALNAAGFEYDDCYTNACCQKFCAGCYWAKYGMIINWYTKKRFNVTQWYIDSSSMKSPDWSREKPSLKNVTLFMEWSGQLNRSIDFHNQSWGNRTMILRNLINPAKYEATVRME